MKTPLSLFKQKQTSSETISISKEQRLSDIKEYWQERSLRPSRLLANQPIIVNLTAVLTCECMDEQQLKQLTKKLCLISQGGSA